jgi:hypothetical protein
VAGSGGITPGNRSGEMSERKNCQGNCGNEHGEKCVPFFDVQNTMMHYNWANRRMLIALLSVLATMAIVVGILAIIVGVFTSNQTKREQMWQETIKSMYSTTAAEVDHGQQNADY